MRLEVCNVLHMFRTAYNLSFFLFYLLSGVILGQIKMKAGRGGAEYEDQLAVGCVRLHLAHQDSEKAAGGAAGDVSVGPTPSARKPAAQAGYSQ